MEFDFSKIYPRRSQAGLSCAGRSQFCKFCTVSLECHPPPIPALQRSPPLSSSTLLAEESLLHFWPRWSDSSIQTTHVRMTQALVLLPATGSWHLAPRCNLCAPARPLPPHRSKLVEPVLRTRDDRAPKPVFQNRTACCRGRRQISWALLSPHSENSSFFRPCSVGGTLVDTNSTHNGKSRLSAAEPER